MEEEIQLLESYFCQPGEFTKEVGIDNSNAVTYSLYINYPIQIYNSKLNVQFRLSITGDDIRQNLCTNKSFSLLTTSPTTTTTTKTTVTSNFKSREFLSEFKKLLLDHIERLSDGDDGLSLFTICIWIKENIQDFLNKKYLKLQEIVSSEKTLELDTFYSTIIKLDHIRSKKRYSKFLQAASKNLALDIELLEAERLIFLKVISQSEEAAKDFVKTLRTSLVDVDSTGKPCKERMSEMLTISLLTEKPKEFSIAFKQQHFENVNQICRYFENFGLNIEIQ